MYMIRDVFHCRRGQAPAIVADMKAFHEMFVRMGNTTGRIYVDMTGRFDTVVMEVEMESLDQYYTLERGLYVNPDPDTARLTTHTNEVTVTGYREIYEVIV
jgi:hypothetical protein